MDAPIKIVTANLRNIGTSVRVTDISVAALAALALSLAFPKIGAGWLAPVGAAGLFWLWQGASWKRAFWLGWFAGTLFFCINLSWFGHTVGAFVGPFAFAVVFVPATMPR